MQTSSIGELEEEGGPEKGEAQRHWLQESASLSVSPSEDISTIRYETMKLGRKLGVGFRALSLVLVPRKRES